jgi:hypothetical protein
MRNAVRVAIHRALPDVILRLEAPELPLGSEHADRARAAVRKMTSDFLRIGPGSLHDAGVAVAQIVRDYERHLASAQVHLQVDPPKHLMLHETAGGSAEDLLDYSGTSEAAVTAVVRAVDLLRKQNPDVMPNKKQIKKTAKKAGGAGDLAIEWALEHKLVTPDFLVTALGLKFLAERT